MPRSTVERIWPGGGTSFTAVIVGCGLIGGAAALAIRRRWRHARVVGVDRSKVLQAAHDAGAIDEGVSPRGLGALITRLEPELIVLAMPVGAIVDTLPTVARGLDPLPTRPRLVVDMGSVKGTIVRAAHDANCAHFVGGHPMAGREMNGFDAATPDLFDGARFVLCGGRPADRRRAVGFARGLGARPLIMDADVHDRCVALVSHTPHLSAIALMQTAADLGATLSEHRPAGLPFEVAAGSWRDATRVAASDPGIWHDIVEHNRDAILETLGEYIRVLQTLQRAVRRGDGDVLHSTVDARALARLRRKIASKLPPVR